MTCLAWYMVQADFLLHSGCSVPHDALKPRDLPVGRFRLTLMCRMSCRVEDDDSCSSFPFNSCGTAAYVAPEALICNKKVNSSVDVYAFGILCWEM